eukprot:scaffold9489_cov56-Isochrysis_galbana.AAC.1
MQLRQPFPRSRRRRDGKARVKISQKLGGALGEAADFAGQNGGRGAAPPRYRSAVGARGGRAGHEHADTGGGGRQTGGV